MGPPSPQAPCAPGDLPFVERWYRFDRIDSTNTFARGLAEGPSAGRMLVVTAVRQSAGRGQRGNSFLSDSDTGLWVSIVVQLQDIEAHFAVNRALALAACSAAEAAGVSARIKWPNDIVVGERKLAGILLENVPGAPGRIVAGLGMNVSTPAGDFPDEIRPIATSLAAAGAGACDVDGVLVRLLTAFEHLWHGPDETVHRAYAGTLAGVGACVQVGDCVGVLEGVDREGRACLRCDSGPRYFSSGPLRFVKQGSHGETGHADKP